MALLASFGHGYRAERATRRPRPKRTPLLTHAGRYAARILPTMAVLRTLLLTLAGFGCLTAAAWTIHLAAGLAAAGVSFLVLEYLTASGDR